jgi:hypothetical protein
MPPVADKVSPLILEALAHAAAEPHGTLLLAAKNEPGLFPNTTAGKVAAKKCLDERWLGLVRSQKTTRELYAATPAGLDFLLREQQPKQVLEDFLRVLEDRQREVAELRTTAARMADGIESLRGMLARVLPQVNATKLVPAMAGGTGDAWEPEADLAGEIAEKLTEWAESPVGITRDCPLPDLFRMLNEPPTIGTFHDALRTLHSEGRVYLHPWTGPLYAIPEPACALLVGHEIAYYASLR